MDWLVFLSSSAFPFLIISVGYLLGNLKFHGFSFDVSAVLITSILLGYIISCVDFANKPEFIINFSSTAKQFSSIGTSLFMSSVGLSCGYSLHKQFKRKNLIYFFLGCLIPLSSFGIAKIILIIDKNTSISSMLGILSGALTSTPGMSQACNRTGINADEVTLGYGSSYIIGVLSVTLFMQLMSAHPHIEHIDSHSLIHKNSSVKDFIIQIGIVIFVGGICGNISFFTSEFSIGNSCGILLIGIALGYLINKKFAHLTAKKEYIDFCKSIGLGLFFVGSGFSAGLKLNHFFNPMWLFYSIVLSCFPIVIGSIFGKIFKFNISRTLSFIAGSMTSTPSLGILTEKRLPIYTDIYSLSYLGSLITTLFTIQLFY